jgi:hypothetical protein
MMPLLEEATTAEKTRLLELFPSAAVKDYWPKIKGKKEAVCESIAALATTEQLIDFVRKTFGLCKQHVYIFGRGDHHFVPPDEIAGGSKVVSAHGNNEAIYIVRLTYKVALQDPWANAELDFLWPIKIQRTRHHIVVRFVSMEKKVDSYFDRPCILLGRAFDEDDILRELAIAGAGRSDLHKGIKALWGEEFMDSPRTKFKKPKSVASETMDEERGIRRTNTELYKQLKDSVLLNTLFLVEKADCGVSAFSVECTQGFLTFPRYSKPERNTDFVIEEILERNQ